jgi:hypothetical protein
LNWASTEGSTAEGLIRQRILIIRGERVIVDADLARFYGVSTRRLNEQVRRNASRFPADFAFQLTLDEKAGVIAKCDHLSGLRFAKALPLVFTEHGAIMAASVLNSARAVEMSVFVVRAFVSIRRAIAGNRRLAQHIDQLERRLADHDDQILNLIRAIKELATPPPLPPRRRIGFKRAPGPRLKEAAP